MRKVIGEVKQQARAAAVSRLAQLKGRSIETLKDDEVRELLAAVLQLLGLADQDGNIT